MHIANIVLPDGRKFAVTCTVISYDVRGFIIHTTSGKPRTAHGCRNANDAFRVAKHLARKWKAPLPDTRLWKLEYV